MCPSTILFRRVVLCASALLLLLGSGCATVTRGLNDSVRIESQPSGATIRLGNGRMATTPATVSLPRKHSMQVTFELAGYESTTAVLTPSRSKTGKVATSGNVLIGGLLGVGIDAGTGAVFDLFPNPLIVRLKALRVEGAPLEWSRLRARLARSEVRDLLGDPVSIHGTTGDQEWTYADGGRVYFTNYFTVRWEAPPPAPTAATLPVAVAEPLAPSSSAAGAQPAAGAIETAAPLLPTVPADPATPAPGAPSASGEATARAGAVPSA